MEYKTSVFYAGGGSEYTFPFEYLQKSFVKVRYQKPDGAFQNLEFGKDYNVEENRVKLTTASDSADKVNIYRSTPTDRMVKYVDASILKAHDMNVSELQTLHIMEEQTDYLSAYALFRGDNANVWEANTLRIINLATPLEPTDAVNKAYVDEYGVSGAFLPLAGGTMTGSIQFINNGKVFAIRNTDAGNINLGWSWVNREGAGLGLRSTDYSNPGEFTLFARNANTTYSLTGTPDGSLTWNNKDVERVSVKGTYGIRFESGIQICWGELPIPAGTSGREVSGTMTFPYPFSNTNYVLAFGNDWLASSSEYFRAEGRNMANFKFTAVGVNTNSHKAFYIAIGYWK